MVIQVLEADGTSIASEKTYTAAELRAFDDVNASYPLSSGGTTTVQHGASLRTLLIDSAPAVSATFAEVVGPDVYGRHPLSQQELGPPGSAFPGSDLVPAFYSFGAAPTEVGYIRPQRTPSDPNNELGPDLGNFLSDQNGALLVRVHTSGQLLTVGATATAVGTDQRTYQLASDPTGPGYTPQWVLPDGTTSAEASPTYTFGERDQAGTYPASVALDGPDGSFGWGRTTLQAGPAPSPSPTPTASPGTGGGGGASNGPTRSPHPSASGNPNPQQSPSGSGSTAPSDPETLPPPTLPPVETQGPTAAPQPTRTPTPTPTPTATPTTSGEEVTGLLLAAADTSGGQVLSDAPSPSPSARALADTPLRVSTTVWLVAVSVLLAIAGGLSESQGARRWLRRRASSRRMEP